MESLRFELLATITLLTFGAVVILSIVSLKLRWYAFYIPIVGAAVIFAEVAIWSQLINSAY